MVATAMFAETLTTAQIAALLKSESHRSGSCGGAKV
jgi:hypothetical protein